MDADLVIIGSGMGGATLAAALAPSGKRILIVEAGDYLPDTPETRDGGAIHARGHFRPKETWLLKVSGPCLDWGSASPTLRLSSSGAYVMAKFDRILIEGSPVSCRIEEIRPVDVNAVREAETAMRAQASSGT